jgi:hypothetical protein
MATTRDRLPDLPNTGLGPFSDLVIELLPSFLKRRRRSDTGEIARDDHRDLSSAGLSFPAFWAGDS